MSIKQLLTRILNCLKVDYIVEEGTNGIWTYRKWNSGLAECWGLMTTTPSTWTALTGNLYYSDTRTQSLPFAMGSVVTDLTVNGTARQVGGNVGWAYNPRAYTVSSVAVNFCKALNTSAECKVDFYIRGKWNNLGGVILNLFLKRGCSYVY